MQSAPLNTSTVRYRFQAGGTFLFDISTFGWKDGESDDIEQDDIVVTIWAPISTSTGRAFSHTCNSPEELWEYIREIIRDPLVALKKYFNYEPPPALKPKANLPLNLGDLFK